MYNLKERMLTLGRIPKYFEASPVKLKDQMTSSSIKMSSFTASKDAGRGAKNIKHFNNSTSYKETDKLTK